LLQAVDEDFAVAVVPYVGFSVGVDIVLWNDELMVGNRDI